MNLIDSILLDQLREYGPFKVKKGAVQSNKKQRGCDLCGTKTRILIALTSINEEYKGTSLLICVGSDCGKAIVGATLWNQALFRASQQPSRIVDDEEVS